MLKLSVAHVYGQRCMAYMRSTVHDGCSVNASVARAPEICRRFPAAPQCAVLAAQVRWKAHVITQLVSHARASPHSGVKAIVHAPNRATGNCAEAGHIV